MDRNSLQYQSLRQRCENTERQLKHLYTLLYSLSLEVTKLRNNQSESDVDTTRIPKSVVHGSVSDTAPRQKTSLPMPSSNESPSDAINRLLSATRS